MRAPSRSVFSRARDRIYPLRSHLRKGKPVARRGRKVYGPFSREVAGLPKGGLEQIRASYSHGPDDIGWWLRSILQNSLDIITIVDPHATLIYANPACERALGYDPVKMVGTMNVLDHIHPEDLPRILEEWEELPFKEGKTTGTLEYRFRHADGSWRWLESVGVYLDDDPAVGGVVVNSRDVTERKQTEEALKAAEARYRTLVEQIPVVTYIDRADDPDTSIYTSPQIEELLGYKPEEWQAEKLWSRCLHPEDEARILRADERFETRGEPFGEEYRLLAKDGSVVWVREEAVLVEDEAGEPLYLQGVILDITEQKEAVEELRRSERRFRALTQNSSDLVTLMGVTGAIRYQSPSVERILGYGQEETVGDNAFDYVHPEDLSKVEMAFAEGLKDHLRRPTVEYRFRHKDGSWRWIESVGTNMLADPEVGGYVVNSRDVTARRTAEERYRRLAERIPVVPYIEEPDEGEPAGYQVTYMSPRVEEILGYPVGRFMEDSGFWNGLIHPEDLGAVLAEDERVEETGEPFSMEYRMTSADGETVWVRDEALLVRGEKGEPLYWQGVLTDVTTSKALEEQLRRRAFHDQLTGLPNRQSFVERLVRAHGRTKRSGRKVAVLFMDLDGFKVVNDSLGHETGDLLLVAIGERLRHRLRPGDTLARFGGDEFVVLLEEIKGSDGATEVAGRITECFERPFVVGERKLFVSASIGVALSTAGTTSPEDLLRDADTAMYMAKDEHAGYRVFDPAMHERVLNRLGLENDLRHAIGNDEFRLYFQPKIRLDDDTIAMVEVLLRWQHPQRGLLMPDEFIPMAEETGLIAPVGRWVLGETCRQLRRWLDHHPRAGSLVACVNVSAGQLRYPDLLHDVRSALEDSGIEAGKLVLEITESALVDNMETSMTLLKELRSLGVRVALDDFGSDYSSLSYLMQLPVDIVKIDGSFAQSLGESPRARVIVEAIISLAHALGLEAVGEGVESAEQLDHLRSMGCDLVQGYHLARPMPNEELDRILASRKISGPQNAPQENGSRLRDAASDDATDGAPNGAKSPGSETPPRSPFRFWSGR
jgi:diguanylate cyclase (GGDEF)-like protein/PAS domain S-box-containing protein